MNRIHSDEEEAEMHQYAALPVNKPKHLVTCDEAILKLIKVAKLIQFKLDTPDSVEPMVTIILRHPEEEAGTSTTTFKGKGPSIGHALKDVLDNVRIEYPNIEDDA